MASHAWTEADLIAAMSADCHRLNAQQLGLSARPAVKPSTTPMPQEPSVAYLDLPATSHLPERTTEGELLAKIRELARLTGWECYHTWNSQNSEAGWPDIVLCDGESLLIYELKDNRRKPTAKQETWISLLQHTGKVEAGIWRPRDWPQIVERLSRTQGPQAEPRTLAEVETLFVRDLQQQTAPRPEDTL